jgi:acetolactate synthase I/III small subunit
VAKDQVIVEISGQEKKIVAFVDMMRPFGILELARTGRIAMVRGVCRPDPQAPGTHAEAANIDEEAVRDSLA